MFGNQAVNRKIASTEILLSGEGGVVTTDFLFFFVCPANGKIASTDILLSWAGGEGVKEHKFFLYSAQRPPTLKKKKEKN